MAGAAGITISFAPRLSRAISPSTNAAITKVAQGNRVALMSLPTASAIARARQHSKQLRTAATMRPTDPILVGQRRNAKGPASWGLFTYKNQFMRILQAVLEENVINPERITNLCSIHIFDIYCAYDLPFCSKCRQWECVVIPYLHLNSSVC